MSQNDFLIANQTAPTFRADLNTALQALASNSSGATAPSSTYANMLWYDTATNILKMRSEADDAWINLGTLDQGTNTFAAANAAPLVSPAFTGTPTAPTATVGTNTTQLATTAFVQASKGWVSPDFTDTITGAATWDGNLTTVAHGLGTIPSFVWGFLRCRVANSGYSVGDRISTVTGLGNSQAIGMSYDATNVYLVAFNPVYFRNDGVSSFTVDDSFWDFELEVWA